jgi:hypothetical protein
MRRAAIVSPLRTPVGAFGGALRDVPVETLGSVVTKAVLEGPASIRRGLKTSPSPNPTPTAKPLASAAGSPSRRGCRSKCRASKSIAVAAAAFRRSPRRR